MCSRRWKLWHRDACGTSSGDCTSNPRHAAHGVREIYLLQSADPQLFIDIAGNIDLTCNEPDLFHADLVRAIDKGARNAELLKHFPDRPAFVLDPVTLRTERIR